MILNLLHGLDIYFIISGRFHKLKNIKNQRDAVFIIYCITMRLVHVLLCQPQQWKDEWLGYHSVPVLFYASSPFLKGIIYRTLCKTLTKPTRSPLDKKDRTELQSNLTQIYLQEGKVFIEIHDVDWKNIVMKVAKVSSNRLLQGKNNALSSFCTLLYTPSMSSHVASYIFLDTKRCSNETLSWWKFEITREISIVRLFKRNFKIVSRNGIALSVNCFHLMLWKPYEHQYRNNILDIFNWLPMNVIKKIIEVFIPIAAFDFIFNDNPVCRPANGFCLSSILMWYFGITPNNYPLSRLMQWKWGRKKKRQDNIQSFWPSTRTARWIISNLKDINVIASHTLSTIPHLLL